jgi:hypothetical protein
MIQANNKIWYWIKLQWYYWFRGGRERDRLAWEMMQLNKDYLHLEREYRNYRKQVELGDNETSR